MLKYVLCGEKTNCKVFNSLEAMGFTPVRLPSYKCLPESVSSHPDMLIYRMRSGAILTYAGYFKENRSLFNMLCCEVVTEDTIPDNVYPNDIYLNALRLGDTVYGRCDILSQIILNDTKNAVNIHQGYARCSACVIDQNAIITADRSIAGAAGARGVEVTLIESGNIELDGYRYGFIGGASGLFDGCVAFIGDPMTHPSGDKITAAVLNRGMNIIILDDGVLCDCGGLIFI